jgi:DNA-binding response OmpR family regulator
MPTGAHIEEAESGCDSCLMENTARLPRVLVVEDDLDTRELVQEALDEAGYVTQTAGDGPEALRVAREFLPDIGVIDIGLPSMSGLELAARLRELPALEAMGLVAITGDGREQERKELLAGFDGQFLKPFDMNRLSAYVAALHSELRP